MQRVTVLMLTCFLSVIACRGEHDTPEEKAEEKDNEADDTGAGGGVVHLSKEAIARNKVRVDVAKGGRLGAGVDIPAEVMLAPDQIAHVTLLVPGRITEVKKTLGDKVKAGEVIASVESAELGAAQSARAQAEAEVSVAKKALDRQIELKNAGIGTQRTYDEAEAALRRAEADLGAANQRTRVYGSGGSSTTVSLRAPFDGEIVERHASIGEVAEAGGEPLFVVANLSTVVVEARVYEPDVAAAVAGARVRITLQAYPGQSWESKLDYVSPRLDEKSRTLAVRMTLKNDGRLKPGLFGTVTLLGSSETEDPRAVLPADAVQRAPQGDIVFVPGERDGEFKAVAVVVGARRGGEVEIQNGVAVGDRVVVEGAFVVKSELFRGAIAADDD